MDAASQADLRRRLEAAGIDHPQKEIDLILARANGDVAIFDEMISRRLKREPLERIFGEATFYNLTFKLHPAVFKPCFETETTMEYGLLHLKDRQGPVRILDLGTGTGCILLTLLHQLPNATGLGIDINLAALEIARNNAITHGLADRAEFRQGNWLDGIDETFDLVISNPPRVPSEVVPYLVLEVSKYDPKDSVDGGPSGIEFYQLTAKDFRRVANDEALAVMQIGGIVADQALLALRKAGYPSAEIRRDYKMGPNALVFGKDPEAKGLWARLFG